MSWKIVEHDGWVETYPWDEEAIHDHVIYTKQGQDQSFFCECKCGPRLSIENGIILINHNSFDGREGVEWANELINL